MEPTEPSAVAAADNWDAFISHASEDKAEAADPIYEALTKRGVRVWYDKAELRIGDSLRKKIDEGLSKSRYGIVILSSRFFEKDWPQAELDGLASLEIGGRKVILPVWHGLTFREVRDRSPLLAGRLAAKTEDGIDAVVDELYTEITGQISEPVPSLHTVEPEIGSAGIGPSRALRSAIRAGRQRDVKRIIDEIVDQLSTTALRDLPTDSRDAGELLRVADGLEPMMASLLASMCEVVESDRDSLPTQVRAIYSPTANRVMRSGTTAWIEVPTWVVWWLQTAFAGYLAWREDWSGLELLATQAWVDTGAEYRPSVSLSPTDAGHAIAVTRHGQDDATRYRDLLPVIDLARTIRKVGYFKAEHPHFIDADDMPFKPIAIGLFLISVRCVQLGQPSRVWAWQYMGGYVTKFVRRLEVDLALQRRIARDLFAVDLDTFRTGFNDWVKAALGPGWRIPGGPFSGPFANFDRIHS